jgi:mannonate dehydratase
VKLGLNLSAGMVTDDNLCFARQLGVTQLVAHLPNQETLPSTVGGFWSVDDLRRLREHVERSGLTLAAIENFPPSHWDQILLGAAGREAQLENVKRTIRNMGEAGIPCMGYYFSLAGVWGRVPGPFARGGAVSVGYLEGQGPEETPIPHGQVWGRAIDPSAPAGDIGTVTHEQMWERLTWFLQRIVPVAEEAGVRLAAHPDDPPLPVLRGTARLITHPDHYQRLLNIAPSPANALEFCQGTVAEMAGSDVYDAVRRFSAGGNIAYVHFRNVRGKVPNYEEVFIDEGDVDMLACLRLYHENGYHGVIVPDHTPHTTCPAPWHAGMAYALGFMRAGLLNLGALEE